MPHEEEDLHGTQAASHAVHAGITASAPHSVSCQDGKPLRGYCMWGCIFAGNVHWQPVCMVSGITVMH